MQAAQKALSRAPRIGETGKACQAIIWFTDGAIDITGNFDKNSDSQAIAQLCGVAADSSENSLSSGVIPSLRRSNITLIGVLLRPQTAGMTNNQKKTQVESRVSYFQSIVEGVGTVDSVGLTGGGNHQFNCGFSKDPNYANGAMLEAKNVNELAQRFAQLFMTISTGDLHPIYSDEFQVENGISKVSAVIPSANWQIDLPNGEKPISPANPGPAFINSVGDVSTVAIPVNSKAHGNWKISHENSPKPAIYFESGLKIKLDSNLVFQANGKPQKISGTIIDAFGKPAALSNYLANPKMSVTPLDGSGLARASKSSLLKVDSSGKWSGEVLPFDGLSNSTLQIELTVSSKSHELPTVKQTFTVPLTIPGQFCKTADSTLKLSDLVYKKSPAQGLIKIQGSNLGTCSIAFLSPNVLSDPIDRNDKSFKYDISDPTSGNTYKFGEYITVEKGATRNIQISVNDTKRVNGETFLRLPIKLNAPEAAAEIRKTIDASFMNTTKSGPKWLVLFLVSLLGIAIPLGILYLVNSAFAKFRFEGIRYTVIPVLTEISSIGKANIKVNSDRPDLLLPADFGYIDNGSNRKSFEVNGAGTIVARMVASAPKNPFGVITGTLLPSPGSFIVSSEQGTSRDFQSAEASLNPNKLFFVTVAPNSISKLNNGSVKFEGVLGVFLSEEGGSFDRQIPGLIEDIKVAPFWDSLGQFLATSAPDEIEMASNTTANVGGTSGSNDPWVTGSNTASGTANDDPWGISDQTSSQNLALVNEKKRKFGFGGVNSKKENRKEKKADSSETETKLDVDPDDPWAL